MGKLEGKVALVTGSGRDIGRATVLRLAGASKARDEVTGRRPAEIDPEIGEPRAWVEYRRRHPAPALCDRETTPRSRRAVPAPPRFLRWSSTGNAAARPDTSPALHFRWLAAPKHSLSTARSSSISRSTTSNH
jgi:hypothetical protein